MTNPAHILDTALLVFAAYLLGCCIGYGARRLLHISGGLQKTAAEPVAAPQAVRPRTPAARLAATASREMPPLAARATAPPKAEPESVATPPQKTEPKAVDPKPMALQRPRGGKADNLKLIKGIGPKIEASLNALGIFHIDQIAAWTTSNIDWVDGQLTFKGRIRRERWVEQAAELSKEKT